MVRGQLKSFAGSVSKVLFICLRMIDIFLQEAGELRPGEVHGCCLSIVHLLEVRMLSIISIVQALLVA